MCSHVTDADLCGSCRRRRCEPNTQPWLNWSTPGTSWSWTRLTWRRWYRRQVSRRVTPHRFLNKSSQTGREPQLCGVTSPAGKRVLILNGSYRDTEAVLEGIDEKKFCATLTLDSVSVPRLQQLKDVFTRQVLTVLTHRRTMLFIIVLVQRIVRRRWNERICSVSPPPQGHQKGKTVEVAYEDFSKLAWSRKTSHLTRNPKTSGTHFAEGLYCVRVTYPQFTCSCTYPTMLCRGDVREKNKEQWVQFVLFFIFGLIFKLSRHCRCKFLCK